MAVKVSTEGASGQETLDPNKAPSDKFQQKLHLMIHFSKYFDVSLKEACRLLEEHESLIFGHVLTDEQS